MKIYRNSLPSAVIFDMDGLLIDSEDLWKEAEVEVFGELGLELTIEMCRKTTGMGAIEAAEFWYNVFPWEGPTEEEVADRVFKKVNVLIETKGKLMPGVEHVLDTFQNLELKIGLASGSRRDLIVNAMKQFKLYDRFDAVHSAQDEDYSKPHPAVYLTMAEILQSRPVDCIAFEDSLTGIIAAKAAKMKVVAVPDKNTSESSKYDIADIRLNSLEEFNKEHLKLLLEI